MIRLQDGVGVENLIRSTDQGRCTKRNVGNCRATYVLHSVAPAVRQNPDGDLEILVSNPIWLSAPTALDGPSRPVNGRQRSVAGRLHQSAPKTFQMRSCQFVVSLWYGTPPRVSGPDSMVGKFSIQRASAALLGGTDRASRSRLRCRSNWSTCTNAS